MALLSRFIIVVLLAASMPQVASAEPAKIAPLDATPVGFGHNAAGACVDRSPSCICEVTTLADGPAAAVPGSLRACAETREAKWIVFRARGTIRLQRPIQIASNKTIDGRKLSAADIPVAITSARIAALMMRDSHNIIVTDLVFPLDSGAEMRCRHPLTPADNSGCPGPIGIQGASRDIWINHNTFDHCGDKCLSVWAYRSRTPGTVANGGDLISISGNLFRDSYFGILVGVAANVPREEIPREMRVSIYDNLFLNIFRRSPRAASFAKVHVFNNVVKYWGDADGPCTGEKFGFAASSVGEAQLLLEGNIFVARPNGNGCKVATEIEGYESHAPTSVRRGAGKLKARDNVVENGATIGSSEPNSVFDPGNKNDPAHFYSYTLRSPTPALEEEIKRTAGARGYGKSGGG